MKIVVIANVPVWILPKLSNMRHDRHYATWLEALIPAWEHKVGEFDLHWVTFCKETVLPIIVQEFGQTFHILPRGSLAIQMVSGYVTEILRVRKLIKQLAPDLVHAWGSEEVCGLAGGFSGVKARLFSLQGCLTACVRVSSGCRLLRLQAGYERLAVNRYRFGTAESRSAAKLLAELHPAMAIELVDYGVNVEFFAAKWNPAASPEVLFVGYLSGAKGIRELVEVSRDERFIGIHFKIAGDGPLLQELASVSGPNVQWLGKCSREEVVRHMETAWVLALPTFADTGPTVVKEARVVGLPVVTTTAAGAATYIEAAGCGHVISPGDKWHLADAILNVCQSRSGCLEMGGRGWEEHRRRLHPDTTVADFTRIYQQMLSK